jgi:MoaA/NifB/PqqE/SkfB family radical SAM enzyme
VGNLSPAISLEGRRERTDARRGAGTFDKVMGAMDLLKERGAVFGVSITVTRDNVMEVTSDGFIDFLVDKGVTYGWLFHYIPIGRDPDPDLMVTPEQRAYLAERIPYIRTHKPIMLADFWNDGEMTGGCIAGGRRYFHINAAGDVEPCAFVHFAVDNIKDKTLLEVLRSPLFASFQKRQPFCENHLRPCPVIDNPDALRAIVAESGARPTHPGAETVLEGLVAESLDRKAKNWAAVCNAIWEKRRSGHQAQSACRKCE